MNLLKPVGAFRELTDKQIDPSIEDLRGKLCGDIAERVVKYLQSGTDFFDWMEWPNDVFTDEAMPASLSFVTDGVWMWRNDLIHYVKKYRVGLPDEFLEHALKNGVAKPVKLNDELSRRRPSGVL